MSGFTLVHCSCPDSDSANTIATELVEQGLAACVNIIPGCTSVYRWQGRIEKRTEQLLLIKTHQQMTTALQQAIVKLHPDETPAIFSTHIDNGLPGYLSWLADSLDPAET